jgi:hypothetical protein
MKTRITVELDRRHADALRDAARRLAATGAGRYTAGRVLRDYALTRIESPDAVERIMGTAPDLPAGLADVVRHRAAAVA